MDHEGGMSSRHHAQVPDEYASLKSPEMTDADVLQGQELYDRLCASCHGEDGMGNGPAAASLDPAPAPVAHTSTMLGDGYLYWRIAEGGAEFKSTMPGWKNSLTEHEIWAMIAYMRALGSGEGVQSAFHDEMLLQAVEQSLVTQAEADGFLLVHDIMDEYRAAHADELPQDMDEAQDEMLSALVEAGTISQAQADDFVRIHQLLIDAGLME
jgi:mono/diheme cytochrome c family protein